jgi:hypothetical protein
MPTPASRSRALSKISCRSSISRAFHYVSALKGQGLEALFRSVDAAYKAATADLPTPKLTRALIDAVARQAPPRSGLFRPKLRYAHQGGRNPPLIVIHGNALDKVPESYRRYLEHTFREVSSCRGRHCKSSSMFPATRLPTKNRQNRTVANRSRSTSRKLPAEAWPSPSPEQAPLLAQPSQKPRRARVDGRRKGVGPRHRVVFAKWRAPGGGVHGDCWLLILVCRGSLRYHPHIGNSDVPRSAAER